MTPVEYITAPLRAVGASPVLIEKVGELAKKKLSEQPNNPNSKRQAASAIIRPIAHQQSQALIRQIKSNFLEIVNGEIKL